MGSEWTIFTGDIQDYLVGVELRGINSMEEVYVGDSRYITIWYEK